MGHNQPVPFYYPARGDAIKSLGGNQTGEGPGRNDPIEIAEDRSGRKAEHTFDNLPSFECLPVPVPVLADSFDLCPSMIESELSPAPKKNGGKGDSAQITKKWLSRTSRTPEIMRRNSLEGVRSVHAISGLMK